ncbi:MAG: hypothetical protein U1E29_01235, partial [Coriobacteriia bacterium]|nr:hypothetical protein [Coriobacteriia bacterium]
FADAVWLSMVALLAIPAILVLNMIRGILDAIVAHPINTYAAVAGLVIATFGMITSGGNPMVLTVSYVLGMTVAAAISLVVLLRVSESWRAFRFPWLAFVLGSIAGAITYFSSYLVSDDRVSPLVFISCVAIACVAATIAVAWWIPEDFGLRTRVRQKLRRIGSAVGLDGVRR